MTPPEFHRPERIDTIGEGARSVTVTAEPAECAALATRFGLVEIKSLVGVFALQRHADGIIAHGRVTAQAVQSCVVTGDGVPASIDELVTLRFVDDDAVEGDEIELTADALDIIPYSGGAIDLGEATAESMALALDPFPRSPNAEPTLKAAGVLREDEVGPFSELAALKAKLSGRND